MVLKLLEILIIYLAFGTADDINIRPSLTPTGKDPPKSDKPEDRIINGFTPNRFANPWVVLLVIQFPQGVAYCTGSLISSQWVVTAGHCAQSVKNITVALGLFNRTVGPAQTINVPPSNIFVHPNIVLNLTATINDIALLRLNPRANILLRSIKPIRFACPINGNFAGLTGRACGWGITSDTATSIPTVLQCVNMPVITNSECTKTWGGKVRQTNICTRTVNNRTACFGDSGGPLTVINGIFRREKLIGVTSFGSNPCAGTSPDVFTRVSSFSSFIRQTAGVLCDPL